MTIRFRYLAADGHEVEVATAEELAQALARGELREDTLVFDADRDGWAPLRTHEVFLTAIAPALPDFPGIASDESAPWSLDELRLTLEEDTSAPSTEDLVAALVRQREDHSPRTPLFPAVHDLAALSASSAEEPAPLVPVREDVASSPAMDPPAPAPDESPPFEHAPSTLRNPGQATGVSRSGRSGRYVSPRPPARAPRLRTDPPTPREGPRARGPRRVLGTVGIGGGLMTATLLIGWAVAGERGSRETAASPALAGPALLAAAEPPSRGLSAQLTATESEALDDMVLGMDSLRVAFEVESVPAAWLEGSYLADAGAHPEVRYFWERYRTYVEQVRAQEAELFRRHFMVQLEREGVTGSMVSIRMARALRLFDAQRPRRETVYLSMLELADASLDFHDLLAEHEQQIAYEPVSAGFSREPVVEAVALSPELTAEMNVMLDRIFAAIEGVYGERIAPREELAGALARGLSAKGR